MELGAISNTLNTRNVSAQFDAAILRKSMDSMEEMGDSMIKMMERSVYPNLGQNIDTTV